MEVALEVEEDCMAKMEDISHLGQMVRQTMDSEEHRVVEVMMEIEEVTLRMEIALESQEQRDLAGQEHTQKKMVLALVEEDDILMEEWEERTLELQEAVNLVL
jgi:hypothetical protein